VRLQNLNDGHAYWQCPTADYEATRDGCEHLHASEPAKGYAWLSSEAAYLVRQNQNQVNRDHESASCAQFGESNCFRTDVVKQDDSRRV
jgi:hypothetical protein